MRVRRDEGGHLQGILPFTISEVQALTAPDLGPEPEPEPEPAESQETLLDIAVERMVGEGPAAHQVWLPPLDVPDTLDQLMGDLTDDPSLGLVSAAGDPLGGLVVPLGTVDRPREQRRDTLTVNLSGAAGHVAVVGGPRSGKSTMLRTIVTSMSLTTTPLESQFFVLDFGGGTFAPLSDLPHVSGVGTRSEPEVVRRILAEVTGHRRPPRGLLPRATASTRSRPTAAAGRRAAPTTATATSSWSSTAGARSARTSTTSRWRSSSSPRAVSRSACTSSPARRAGPTSAPRCATCFGTRLELRLGDPMDSEIDRKVAALVPSGRPGRGLVQGKLHFLAALPRIDGEPAADTLGDGVENLIKRVSSAWTGPAGPKLRLLPDRIDLDRIRELAGAPRRRAGRAETGGSCSASTRRSSRRSASTPTPSRTC